MAGCAAPLQLPDALAARGSGLCSPVACLQSRVRLAGDVEQDLKSWPNLRRSLIVLVLFNAYRFVQDFTLHDFQPFIWHPLTTSVVNLAWVWVGLIALQVVVAIQACITVRCARFR
jgi:hypothetical protein